MIGTLISGRLRGTPKARTAKNGSRYASFWVDATDKSGKGVFVSCVTFSATAVDAVLRLEDGDSIAVTGDASIGAWEGQSGIEHGINVLVHVVMTAYQIDGKLRVANDPGGYSGA